MIGFIYKITNKKNGKIYIGQTIQPIQRRFNQHVSHAITEKSDHKFARAIRKYGKENFEIEIIEEIEKDKLDEREKYWIKFYNSIQEGYNTAEGGTDIGAGAYYELEEAEKIIQYYYTCHNQIETCKHFNITEYKFRQLLTSRNLPTDYTNYGKHTQRRVFIYELDKYFDSELECAKFLIEKGYTKAKLECVKTILSKRLKDKQKLYNLSIMFEDCTIEDFNKSYFDYIRQKGKQRIIYKIDPNTKKILFMYDSIANASRAIGHSINDVVSGRRGHHLSAGYLWYYEEDYNKEF